MKVVATIPASLDPSAACGPILEPVAGQPVLAHVLDRVARVDKLEGIIVTTTSSSADDLIAGFCDGRGVACVRGDPGNGLGTLLQALKQAEARGGAVIYPDQPLIDPALVDHVVNLIQMTDGMLDWVGNNLASGYPRGMAAEAFTAAALEEADRRCADPDVRRQGTLYLRQNSRFYRLLSVPAPAEHQRPELSLRVETVADLKRVEAVLEYAACRHDLALGEIIAFLDANPGLHSDAAGTAAK